MMTGHEVGAALAGDLTTRAGLIDAYPTVFTAIAVEHGDAAQRSAASGRSRNARYVGPAGSWLSPLGPGR
jgi:hypothetical protein